MKDKELYDAVRNELASNGHDFENLTDKEFLLIWDTMRATEKLIKKQK